MVLMRTHGVLPPDLGYSRVLMGYYRFRGTGCNRIQAVRVYADCLA